VDGGLTSARFAAALALSIATHALLALGVGDWSPPPAATDTRDLVVRLAANPLDGPKALARRAGREGVPHYWPVSQLEVRPQIRTHVMPEYPTDLPSGVNGRVVLELYLSPRGTVDRLQVLRAEPPGRFEQSAVTAFSGARFTPGMRKNKAVHSRLRIEVTYGD
jgi:periplasmic protein TonB